VKSNYYIINFDGWNVMCGTDFIECETRDEAREILRWLRERERELEPQAPAAEGAQDDET
jgi:hypothetical protein